MTAPDVSSAAPGARRDDGGTTLGELLALKPAADRHARVHHEIPVPAEVALRVAHWARHDGAAPETAWIAAWMLLLARWSGRAAVAGGEFGLRQDDPRGTGGGLRPIPSAVDLTSPAGPFLREVDAARRAVGAPGEASHGIEWAWLNKGRGDGELMDAGAAAATVVMTLGLGARGQLAATLPAEVDDELARTLLERIVAVASECCAAPEMRLHEIDTLGDAERVRLFARWNTPLAPGDPAATVHGTFAAMAAARPDDVALVLGDERVSYGALEARATRWARALRAAGVRPGATVGLALDRSLEAIVALLAILKSGAAYLPLDSAYPPARLSFILEDADAAVLVTARAQALLFEGACARPVVLVETLDAAADAAMAVDPAPLPVVGAGALAYVMYTSGSTGTPKGVEIPHDAILRLVVRAGYVHLAPDTVMLHAAPLGFDASTLEIWGPLLNGGRCVLHPEELPTPRGLEASIGAAGVTTAWLTAALFNAVVDDDPRRLGGLGELLIGGEALSVPHVRRLLAALPATALINGYGPTECTTFAATHRIPRELPADARSVPIGRPITATHAHVLGPGMAPLPAGLAGRLYLGGRGLARGYLKRPELTAERFVADPFVRGARLYDTGDLVRWLPDGTLEFIGRADTQVKIRGFRIELGEIEAALATHPAVQACAVLAVAGAGGGRTLAAYLVAQPAAAGAGRVAPPTAAALRAWLAERLPDFMVPTAWLWLDRLPITVNGKLDRQALPAPPAERPEISTPYQLATDGVEWKLCDAFAAVLGLDRVGRLDNFFELGGNSLHVLRALTRLGHEGLQGVTTTMFFRQPTAAAIAAALAKAWVEAVPMAETSTADAEHGVRSEDLTPSAVAPNPEGGQVFRPDPAFDRDVASASPTAVVSESGHEHGVRSEDPTPSAVEAGHGVRSEDPAPSVEPAQAAADEPIAIIAVAGRFPGAHDVDAFWRQLREGRDGITHFADGGLDPGLAATLTGDPNYVKARGLVDGAELFDASFFGISPREAELMDPQQRIFLELAWECLERAGHVPDAPHEGTGAVGVFAGMYNPTYWQRHVQHRPDLVEKLGEFTVMLGNEKDYIATRTAYRLNLTGPAISVHTACSTSLVAISQAFWSLRQGQCRMALAGGASITCPPRSGYLYQEGAMLSPDGATRSFDADAQGTVFSDGAAVVLLKRMSDALADGNEVLALIRGVAVNNDGRDKASFTAPGVEGQAAVIAQAQDVAGVDARSISYVEAHGTATPLGDPVEVEALTQAFRRHTADSGFCRIGSVKSNIGHTVIAAGATGVIKTALALHEEWLPATIHYRQPNPKIAFAASPFVVADRESAWPRGAAPRRAGVSSFGVGGTNAHAVLEEAPLRAPAPPAVGPQRLQLSARTPAALATMATRLADHFEADPQANLADAAFTLQRGRSRFVQRLCVVARTPAEAAAALRAPAHAARRAGSPGASAPALVWMFPGQGAQYAGMGRGLHDSDPVFARALDECIAALQPELAFDLRERLFDESAEAADALRATSLTQPALFCIEMALARTWQARGLAPAALVGHSVGEFVAAVLADVMLLEDAARLVARRGALLQALPAGAMLSVRLAADAVAARLPATLSLAAENGPQACVVAGPAAEIDAFAQRLEAEGLVARRLVTSHAFHSAMMEPAVAPFEALVRGMPLNAPRIPIVSTATGTWLTDAEAIDPRYWARHLRAPVRFSPALRTALVGRPEWGGRAIALLEVGPRDVLSTLARQHAGAGRPAIVAVPSLGDAAALEAERLLLADGQLWTLGVETTASAATPAIDRRRVCLPTYAFERKRHWVDAPVAAALNPVATPVAAPIAAAIEHGVRSSDLTPNPVAASAAVTQPAAAEHGVRSEDLTPSAASAAAVPVNTLVAEPVAPTPTPTPNPATMNAPHHPAPRHAALVDRLRELFGDVAGLDLSDADPSAGFVELGIDSLTLTQVAMQTKKRFGVAVTFRQLSESCRSFDALAQFLDAALPAEAPAAIAAPAAPVVAAPQAAGAATVPAPGVPAMATAPVAPALAPVAVDPNAPFVQQVIAQQMALMAQQLALLGGAAALQPAHPAPVQAAPQPAPVQAAPAPVPVPASSPAPADAPQAAEQAGPVRYDVKKAFGAIARIHTQGGEISALQRARLEAFARRYVERTRKSKDYTVAHRTHLADPRVVNGFRPLTKEITYQIVVEKSQGAHVWDIDGNEYVDVLNGFGMNMFGWRPEFVQEAVRHQLDAGYEIGPQHPLAGEVADLVCEFTGFDRAGLCNTGSEAVMAAIRIARTVTCRNTVVMFAGSYHGTFDEVLVRAGRNHQGIPAAPGIMPDVFDDCRVLDYGTPESLEWLRANADDLAAVLVEPVQSRRPEFQPREFLKEVRAITEKSGTCLIFDEVITGFRMHPGGVQALFDIRADLATYGKVIGGGMPIGVVAGKRAFMDALDGGAWQYGDDSVPTVGVTYFAGTFVRHPLALAAAKASLLHLKSMGPQLQEQLNLRTAAMADELGAFCREVGAPIEIRHFGSLWRVAWLEDHPLQDLLFAMMRSRGVHILDNFPCFMTTAHTPQDIATIKSAFRESVAELQAAGFLPGHAAQEPAPFDATKPPVPGARLGRGPDGEARWYVPSPDEPGKYVPAR
jgi:amino acid adenylation domain-containing protein